MKTIMLWYITFNCNCNVTYFTNAPCYESTDQLTNFEKGRFSRTLHPNYTTIIEGNPESKERLRIQCALLFCCSRSLVSGVQCDVESCLMQLNVGPCHLVSAEIAMAMSVPIENPAHSEVRGIMIRFYSDLWNLRLSYRRASYRVGLFYCTTMHVRILPGRHKPCCVSNSIGTSSSILCTFRTWHRRIFSCFQKWRSTLLVNVSQIMKTWRMLVE